MLSSGESNFLKRNSCARRLERTSVTTQERAVVGTTKTLAAGDDVTRFDKKDVHFGREAKRQETFKKTDELAPVLAARKGNVKAALRSRVEGPDCLVRVDEGRDASTVTTRRLVAGVNRLTAWRDPSHRS